MGIKLANVSFIRRSAAEVCALRELISFKQSKRTGPDEVYFALMSQMKEEQFRNVMSKLAKAGFISYERIQSVFQGHTMTHYSYVLHLDKVQQLIAEGEKFVFKTVLERSSNSQLGMEATSLGKSMTEKEGETNGVITKVPKATPARNPNPSPNPRPAILDIPQFGVPEVMEGLSLFQKQPKYRDLSWQDAWVEFCRSDPWSWIKKAKDAKAAKRNTGKT
jgi:hypothetical protein